LESLFNHRFNRKSLLIAFGGGVIGDMTGYASSIYQRGIDFMQIPTTLLSQVDASVGGKIVKMAVTFNSDFFEYLESADLSDKASLQEAIKQAVQTKADVVAKDEKEHGLRAALNYGHTFGHVIENETNYTHYLHGEAVAIGMVMANALAVKLGLMSESQAKRVKELLERYNLPTSYKVEDPQSFYEAFFLDKKSSDATITFILPVGIGDVKITDSVAKESVLEVLESFGK